MLSNPKIASGVVGTFNNSDYYYFTVTGTQTVSLLLNPAYGTPTLEPIRKV